MGFGIGIWDLGWDLEWGWDGMGMGWDFMGWDLGGKYSQGGRNKPGLFAISIIPTGWKSFPK